MNQTNGVLYDAGSRIYNAAIYARLSDDDADKGETKESDSIVNQKEYIREYLKSMPEIRVCSERADDGFSGVDFFRPGFQQMLEEVRAGEVNCIVVKDLSRLGRNYIDTGKYLQEFARLGVRFIAINDGYDTANLQGQASTILLPIKNLMNDSYSRDISVKIRSHLEVKKRKGEFVGAFAGYGYMKDENDKNRLVVDEYAAEVVRDIFKWKLEGMSQQGISDRLNENGVLSPAEYKRSLGMKYHTGFKCNPHAKWTAVAVGRILRNPLYIGSTVQGKTGRPNYKIKTLAPKPQETWIVVEHTHEGIVTKEEFETVNGLMRKDMRIPSSETTVYPLSGLIFCADCKQNMVRKTVPAKGKRYLYYTCSTNRADKTACTTHNISEPQLMAAVEAAIHTHIESVINIEKTIEFIAALPEQTTGAKKVDKQIEKLKADHEQYMTFKMKTYESFISGLIDKATYQNYTAIYNEKCVEIERAIAKRQEELDAILNAGNPKSNWIEHFKAFRFKENLLDRACLVRLIDRILIHEGGRIEIIFKHHNEYRAALAYIEQRIKDENTKEAG
ncbi:MAG: recombinase [Clostridiales bacterium]|nr:MAG: recombinase [Clostridiales bacterium]